MILVSVVTALGLAGGGVWLFTQGSGNSHSSASHGSGKGSANRPKNSSKPKPVNGRLLLSLAEPSVPAQRPTSGMWVTEQGFVKTGLSKVTGYDPTGGRKWELPLDGEICSASRHATSDNKVALLVRGSKATGDVGISAVDHCTDVVLLDLGTGKKLWQKQARSGDQTVEFRQVAIGGNAVAAGGTRGGAAWSLNDGKELWKPKPEDTCHDDNYGGDGGKLVAMRRCGELEHAQYSVQTLRPNGAVASKFMLPRGIKDAYVVSAAPLIVAVDANDSSGNGVSDLMTIDDSAGDGKLRAKFSMGNGRYAVKCTYDSQSCGNLVVGKESLYLPTSEHQTNQDGIPSNEIVKFDLSNGRVKGKAASPEATWLSPMNMDGEDHLIAYQMSIGDINNAVVSIDPEAFTVTPLLKLSGNSHHSLNRFSPGADWLLWAHNRLYLGRESINKPYDEKHQDYLVEVWGAG
ncbi:PQQ-binding-like beta-propeller repeat protein [Streptomyces sp. NPDC052396]|uniref:outer membrane protein assembly factor BamB family protein n=1 Tax=Streptomyces sp. NPDC052396 TaxID=3365689 RepID=UPI0037CFB217